MNSYKLVWADTREFGRNEDDLIKALEEQVNVYINKGWSCIGGIVLCNSNGSTTRMYQTMVKL